MRVEGPARPWRDPSHSGPAFGKEQGKGARVSPMHERTQARVRLPWVSNDFNRFSGSLGKNSAGLPLPAVRERCRSRLPGRLTIGTNQGDDHA